MIEIKAAGGANEQSGPVAVGRRDGIWIHARNTIIVRIKGPAGAVPVVQPGREDDFLAVYVYEWNYKKSKVNDPKLANKLHWSTTAEEFAGIHGNGKEIDQGKAFWYLWGMVQQEIRNRKLLERYVDHLHERIEDLERF